MNGKQDQAGKLEQDRTRVRRSREGASALLKNVPLWLKEQVVTAHLERLSPVTASPSHHKPMCPKTRQEADTSVTEAAPHNAEVPNTSGFYPAQENPGSGSLDLSGAKQPALPDPPPIEIRILPGGQGLSPAYEIWTEHTAYEFDQALYCVGVRDLDSGTASAEHACLGARLIGGRQTTGEYVDISSPLPAIGHKALLGDEDHPMTVTSPVTRVIMNLWRWSCASRAPRALRA
jgi:hypothetical protein